MSADDTSAEFAQDAVLFARMRAMWAQVDPMPADLIDRIDRHALVEGPGDALLRDVAGLVQLARDAVRRVPGAGVGVRVGGVQPAEAVQRRQFRWWSYICFL